MDEKILKIRKNEEIIKQFQAMGCPCCGKKFGVIYTDFLRKVLINKDDECKKLKENFYEKKEI